MSVRTNGTVGTVGGESREDRFTRKLKDLEGAEHEISKCKEALACWQKKKKALEEWVKIRMENKAKEDKVPKVQVVYSNSMYTLDRTKQYKNKGPTQKQLKGKLVEYFNHIELSDFMSMPTEEKAKSIFEFLYGERGYHQKVSFSKRTLIKKK